MDVVRLINKALSNADFQNILGGDAKIIKYSELGNPYDIDQLLPGDKDYCIILYEDKPARGHWTALSKYNGLYERCDSYGIKPDGELKWIGEKKHRQTAKPKRTLPHSVAKDGGGEVH